MTKSKFFLRLGSCCSYCSNDMGYCDSIAARAMLSRIDSTIALPSTVPVVVSRYYEAVGFDWDSVLQVDRPRNVMTLIMGRKMMGVEVLVDPYDCGLIRCGRILILRKISWEDENRTCIRHSSEWSWELWCCRRRLSSATPEPEHFHNGKPGCNSTNLEWYRSMMATRHNRFDLQSSMKWRIALVVAWPISVSSKAFM